MPSPIKTIANGVEKLFLPNNSFNTTLVSVNFYLPLSADNISKYALLPEILVTCSEDYPDYLKLNYKLSGLYGADAEANISKVGDCICIKFIASSINDRFALDGESPVSNTVQLLLDLIFKPKVKDGAFYDSDLKREKRKLIDRIKGDLNEKRAYARNRLIAEMFEDDPFGVYRLGKAEEVASITGKELYGAWKEMLETAFIRIHTIGEKENNTVYERITDELSKINRHNITDVKKVTALKERQTVKRVCEKMDVAQGKLVMGFNFAFGDDDSTLGAMIMSDIFGGGPYSRLFTNVREKLSLCYYCSATSFRCKGFMMVDCGVEKENAEKAETAILEQLDVMKRGEFSDFEFASSVKSIRDSLKSYRDSKRALDIWYTIRITAENVYSPEEIIEKLESVTKECVVNAANVCKYNTVYKLMPEDK